MFSKIYIRKYIMKKWPLVCWRRAASGVPVLLSRPGQAGG